MARQGATWYKSKMCWFPRAQTFPKRRVIRKSLSRTAGLTVGFCTAAAANPSSTSRSWTCASTWNRRRSTLRSQKGEVTGTCPILPALAQELRTHLSGRKAIYLFESTVTPPTPRAPCSSSSRTRPNARALPSASRLTGSGASVATLLLDAGMPIDQVQKFLRHKYLSMTEIYAETSLRNLGEHYLHALS